MKTAAHPLPHEPEWAAAIQKEVSHMTHHAFITLVTDEPPRVLRVGLGDIPVIKFGHTTGVFDVQLPKSMTPEQEAAWLLGFAKELTDLAADIQSKTATVPA
jgi:hypothetical protein